MGWPEIRAKARADGLVSCAALRRAGSTEVLKWYAVE